LKLILTVLMLGNILIPTKTVALETPTPTDNRIEKLNSFFDKYKCPTPRYAQEYIQAADKYQIPYSLLPAISVQESSCGKRSRFNNYWGWNSARSGFKSIPEGIDFVAGQLAQGKYYKGKTLEKKLRTYNPNPAYGPKIKRLMKQVEN
jgi:hypothetical protein